MSMVPSSSSMDDEIKIHLTQLKKKIGQLTEIISRLAILSTHAQAPTTPIAKLSPIFED